MFNSANRQFQGFFVELLSFLVGFRRFYRQEIICSEHICSGRDFTLNKTQGCLSVAKTAPLLESLEKDNRVIGPTISSPERSEPGSSKTITESALIAVDGKTIICNTTFPP